MDTISPGGRTPFRIKLITEWMPPWADAEVSFRTDLADADADALYCDYTPTEEFLGYPGTKAWTLGEATSHGRFRLKRFKRFLRLLKSSQVLSHCHPDPRYRVPIMTHWGETRHMNVNPKRLEKAVAIVSNAGGSKWWLKAGVRRRNAFVTHPRVDLYGRRQGWARYRRWPWSRAAPPANWRGEVPGFFGGEDWLNALSRYKAMVCFENTQEAYYFTEKFVGAVHAGCIPIYCAHPTVRETFLQGARWVDPQQFGFHVERTLEYALAQPLAEYQEANARWLQGEAVHATHLEAVLKRIGLILRAEHEGSARK
jgi:hypothetical protein